MEIRQPRSLLEFQRMFPNEMACAAYLEAIRCPASTALAASFRIEVKRKQRRSDGTVSLNGNRFEIPSRYRHLEHVHLQYARWDLSRVDLVDPRTGAILCPVKPLDKSANANGQRRRLAPVKPKNGLLANEVESIYSRSRMAANTKRIFDFLKSRLSTCLMLVVNNVTVAVNVR